MAHPTSARIWCRGCRKGGTKWTSIDGEGPTAEERDRLFERYEQHQGHCTANAEGQVELESSTRPPAKRFGARAHAAAAAAKRFGARAHAAAAAAAAAA
jgi:hypothetical protein